MKHERARRESTREASNIVWQTYLKLQSLGRLFEDQRSDDDGAPELVGIGMILVDLGEELKKVFDSLDDLPDCKG